MKRRSVLVVLAVVLATIGTIGIYAYVHGADDRATAGTKSVAVVVAAQRIAAGTSWADAKKDGALKLQRQPASSTPADAVTDLDADLGADAVAQGDIAPGSAVVRAAFAPATASTGVLTIPKGMIAVTTNLTADADVAGYVGPKSQVVVFVTAGLKQLKGADDKEPTTGDDLTITRTVIPRALVLASSQAAPTALVAGSGDSGTVPTASVLVTLALTQQDAERLILAEKTGALKFGLLSGDSKVSQDDGYTNTGVFTPKPMWAR